MRLQHEQSLSKTRSYLYARFKALEIERDYHLSNSLTQQIQAISTYSYTPTTKGDIGNLLALLKKAEIADTDYVINGSTIWLPYGIKYRSQFIGQMAATLQQNHYEEHLFPNLIHTTDFQILCDQIYDFSDQALRVSADATSAVLKPTGESAVYPVFARWLREGKTLPLRVFQAGPFFRYKSSPHPYLRPVECSFMLEAHGAFSSRDEMLKEYDLAVSICKRWVELLCLDALVVSRPISFNRPVSEKTIGFDVLLPNGKTIQTAIAYLQAQVFSRPYDVAFYTNGIKRITHQITYGITERNIFTSLFVHADDLGLRMPANLAPEQVAIICRDKSKLCFLAAEKLKISLERKNIRCNIRIADAKENVFALAVIKGVPVQVIFDEVTLKQGIYELFDRRSLVLKCLKLSAKSGTTIASTLARGDEILLREQRSRRIESTQMLFRNDFDRIASMVQSQSNTCFKVAIHEDDACITMLQKLGLGEYIGTDQTQFPDPGQCCCSCEKTCETTGYLTKRL